MGHRIGLIGGTFDPIHHGHLVAAAEAAHAFALDEVVFVPTGMPWQKSDRLVAPAEDRYLMCVIATASDPRFEVSRIEIDRQGPTYTVETLRAFRDRGTSELFFITGADAVLDILTWRDPDEVLELATFIAASRPGHSLQGLPAAVAGRVRTVEIPALAISSTDIRERVRTKRPIDYLVPAAVVRYIAKRDLYRDR